MHTANHDDFSAKRVLLPFACVLLCLSGAKAAAVAQADARSSRDSSGSVLAITSFTATPNPVQLGQPTHIQASVANASDVSKLFLSLNFGDGESFQALDLSDVAGELLLAFKEGFDFTFPANGFFTITLQVSGSTGSSSSTLYIAVGDSVAVNGSNGMAVSATLADGGNVSLSLSVSQISGAVSADTVFEDASGLQRDISRAAGDAGLIVGRSGLGKGLYRATSTALDINGLPLTSKVRKTFAVSARKAGDSSALFDPSSTAVKVKKLSGKFGFNSQKQDKVTLQGEFLLPPGFKSSGHTLDIGVGNVLESVSVDATGKATLPATPGPISKLKLSFPKLPDSGAAGTETAKISLTLSAVNLSGAGFDTEGITAAVRSDEVHQKSVSRLIQVELLLDGVAYETLAGVQYKVANNTGSIVGRGGK